MRVKSLLFYLHAYVEAFPTGKRRAFGIFNFFFHSFCESNLKPDGIIKIKVVPLSTRRDAISMLMDRCFLKKEIKDIKGVREINRHFFFFLCKTQH